MSNNDLHRMDAIIDEQLAEIKRLAQENKRLKLDNDYLRGDMAHWLNCFLEVLIEKCEDDPRLREALLPSLRRLQESLEAAGGE